MMCYVPTVPFVDDFTILYYHLFFVLCLQFWGVVSHIATDVDATNRTEILKHIDRGKVR